jgi:hypothetical protein
MVAQNQATHSKTTHSKMQYLGREYSLRQVGANVPSTAAEYVVPADKETHSARNFHLVLPSEAIHSFPPTG